MRERQEIEQYFFSRETLDHLARFAMRFPNPCCLCTPSLGAELEGRGVERVTTLDIDERFAHLRGFRRYDVLSPEPLDDRFGVIICDPPFLSLTPQRLYEVARLLSHGDHSQPLVINYWVSRARQLREAFTPFGLEATGYSPQYTHIQNSGRNAMQLYSNVEATHPLRLRVTGI
jgi:hypothetical protein